MTTTLRDFEGGTDADPPTLVDTGDANERLQLLRCPACGKPIHHARRQLLDPVAEHLHDHHTPADFGLSKRGERR